MVDKNKISTIISQLTRLTYENKLKWKVKSAPDTITLGSNSRFPYYAEVPYKGKYVAYLEERYKYHHDEFAYDWVESAKLLLLDDNLRINFEFPQTTALKDLADTIKETTSNLDEVFSDLLVEYHQVSLEDFVDAEDDLDSSSNIPKA